MSAAVAPSNGSGAPEKPEVTIVTEIPESLQRALLLIVKNFFSQEHFLIVYYIMQATCIREENLRNKLHYDQRDLRQRMAALKSEKLVKERLLQQKNDNNRSVSVIFYFINYRAIINVLMYKIDHMRQKLEAREKEDTQKAMYKCSQCAVKYETLDADRLLDPFTGMLKCWRCHGEVVTDETGGPTHVTRSLLAKFNEQLQPLFFVAQELKGIQLAPHLLEPDITKYLDKDDEATAQLQDALDFSQGGGERITLGGKAFGGHRAGPAGIRYAHGDQIIVDLNADSSSRVVEEAKQMPMWLADDAIAGSENAQAIASVSDTMDERNGEQANTSKITVEMLRELEEEEKEPEPKKVKKEEPDMYGDETASSEPTRDGMEEEEEDADEEDDEDIMISVAGEMMAFSEVQGNEELIGRMTDQEREEYARVWEQISM